MAYHVSELSKEELIQAVKELRDQKARFITITVLDLGSLVEVVYHFELGKEIFNILVRTRKDEPIPSITGIYGAAFIAENEAKDMFKLDFQGLNIDLGGRMLKVESAKETTLLKPAVGEQPPIMRFLGRCREKCPASVNIPKYIRQIARGDPSGAYDTVLERAPLPAVLGRVCFAPCMDGCRQNVDERAIEIRLLKRYAADSLKSLKRDVKRSEPTGRRVAVVGGGPSGIAAAYYLGMMGHDATIYEKRERCGGAMLWGIPKYRLPKEILQAEASARFEEACVKVEYGVEIKSLESLFEKGFDAVYVAVGAEKGNRLMIEGEDSKGVMECTELLTSVNLRNEEPQVGDEVIVIGGGNSAMDSARVSKRLGARNVTIFYRRTENEMPALLEEVQAAMREGVSFEFLAAPLKIIPGERLKIIFQAMVPSEPDSTGRRRPIPLEGCFIERSADTIIKAIGSSVDIPREFGLEVDKHGCIKINERYETSRKGVYAGGDCAFGPKSVIEALRDGLKAASEIDKYLGGKGLPEPVLDLGEFVAKPADIAEMVEAPPVRVRELPVDERVKSFDEVEQGFTEDEAIREANRCWRCDWNE